MTILADNQMGGTNDDASNRFGIKLNHDVIDLLGGYNDRYLSGGVSIKIENVKLIM